MTVPHVRIDAHVKHKLPKYNMIKILCHFIHQSTFKESLQKVDFCTKKSTLHDTNTAVDLISRERVFLPTAHIYIANSQPPAPPPAPVVVVVVVVGASPFTFFMSKGQPGASSVGFRLGSK